MIQIVVVAGLAWLLLRDSKPAYPHDMYDCSTGTKYVAETEADHTRMAALGYVHTMTECELPEDGGSTWTDPNEDEDGNCLEGYKRNSQNVCVVYREPRELEPTAVWSIEYLVEGYDSNVVWQLDVKDHRVTPDGTFFVIGNTNHTGFLRSSTSNGTINIPSAVSGGSDSDNVNVYSDLASASAKLDLMANPPDDGSPQPQPQPEGEESGSGSGGGFGGLPPAAGYQLGQNGSYM